MVRYYIPWQDAYYALCEDLSDEEYGSLVRAVQKYAMTGQVRPVIGAAAQYLPAVIEQVNHYAEKCEEQRKRCSAAGKKGGRPKKSNKNVKDNTKIKNREKHNKTESEEKSGVPPSLSAVEAYCQEAGLRVDAATFCDYYEARGWLMDGRPMANWQAAARNWARRERGSKASPPEQAVSTVPDAAEVERMQRLRERLQQDEGDSTT